MWFLSVDSTVLGGAGNETPPGARVTGVGSEQGGSREAESVLGELIREEQRELGVARARLQLPGKFFKLH